jgi:hypothetical protein
MAAAAPKEKQHEGAAARGHVCLKGTGCVFPPYTGTTKNHPEPDSRPDGVPDRQPGLITEAVVKNLANGVAHAPQVSAKPVCGIMERPSPPARRPNAGTGRAPQSEVGGPSAVKDIGDLRYTGQAVQCASHSPVIFARSPIRGRSVLSQWD